MSKTIQFPKRRPGRPRRDAPTWKVLELRAHGWSFRRIAEALGLGYGTVRRAYAGGLLKLTAGSREAVKTRSMTA